MINYTIESINDNIHTDLFRARSDKGGACFESDYLKILCEILKYAGPEEEVSVSIDSSVMEKKEFPNESAKELTRRVIEMHNKLAVIRNTLTQSQLKLKMKG